MIDSVFCSGTAWPKDLVRLALSEFPLTRSQEHGPAHWARVRHHGVRLAQVYGLNPVVPALFALFHDCRRENEYHDPEHGHRAAQLVESLARQGHLRELSSQELSWLMTACAQHSDGRLSGPRMVQVCWDADRLDLGRVGIRPDPRRLCTEAAQELALRAHAYQWSQGYPYRQPPSQSELAFSL